MISRSFEFGCRNVEPTSTDPVARKYDFVQCIGFSLGTGLKFNEYTGLKNDESDWQSKISVMEEAIKTATSSDAIDCNEKCLKIFMAPEFFFRGKIGAYDMDTCSKITDRLRELVNAPQYRDWLFVFGTIIGYSKRFDGNTKSVEAYNYSFIQKGNSGEKDSFVVLKESKAVRDFVNSIYSSQYAAQNEIDTFATSYLEPINKKSETRNENKKINYDSASIIEIDGIRVGIEICLDNIHERLNKAAKENDKPVQIHLVTSCGVLNINMTECLCEKGVAFICDGVKDGYSKVKTRKGEEIECIEQKTQDLTLKNPVTRLFASDKGNIKIHKAIELGI